MPARTALNSLKAQVVTKAKAPLSAARLSLGPVCGPRLSVCLTQGRVIQGCLWKLRVAETVFTRCDLNIEGPRTPGPAASTDLQLTSGRVDYEIYIFEILDCCQLKLFQCFEHEWIVNINVFKVIKVPTTTNLVDNLFTTIYLLWIDGEYSNIF